MDSALYVGTLRHRRFQPVAHEFSYPLFMAFLDIDRIPELMNVSRFAGYNRFNWASFYDQDHFGDSALSLRERVVRDAAANGIELPPGKIFLLTHLRYLGYNFNPVSYFYCYDAGGGLHSILAEVNNTFGETANYWLSGAWEQKNNKGKRYVFPKSFHVSPFMKLHQEYNWTFTTPSESLLCHCVSSEQGQPVFDATLNLAARDWSGAELRRTLMSFPWMTLKVITAIHWQGLKLLRKKVPVVAHPGPNLFDRANIKHWGASWRVH